MREKDLCVLELFGLSGFVYTTFCTSFLLVNFSYIVSTSKYRLVGLNHLYFNMLCDCVIFLIMYFFVSLIILDLLLSQ